MAAGVDLFAVVDALKALLDQSLPRNGRRAATTWGPLAWLRGEFVAAPAGLDAVMLIAASPATRAHHREALVALLKREPVVPARTRLDDDRIEARANAARRLAGLVEQRGPVPWRGEAVARLTALTGLTRAESSLLLAGLPVRDWDEADFIDDDQLSILGLTRREAVVGRMELLTVPHAQRVVLLDAAVPEDPADLWAHGPDVDALAEAWCRLQGRRTPVDERLLAELGAAMGFPTDILRTFAAPAPGDWLHTDGVSVGHGGWIETAAAEGTQPFSDRQLPSAATGLAWLAYHLPVGHPIRTRLPEVHRLVRQRLANPRLLLGSVLVVDPATVAHLAPALVPGISLGPGGTYHHLCPAFVTAYDHPALDAIPDHSPISLRMMLDPAFERMTLLRDDDGLPDGAYVQDTLLSVPHLVSRLAQRFGLHADAAALYLQLLALPDPTGELLRRWTGWEPGRLDRAGAALRAAGLAVDPPEDAEGRELALPGPWLVRRFVPQFEAWKSPLYGFAGDEQPPYRWTLVARPVTELFEAAAGRVLAGDVPR
ncbi:hypothetical protein CS0771_70100 [Catellatospora sp. IY07-71]|uniref:hypothetical protein n=1 Tax=Catellatospora sp. IY07-71 TaxID=2728827 RepID=UPI001BB3CB5C|nr:hypothetical protein [Catellatospora sp. IY07-71]BCJ77466.1 hypothetical protein CS0771_70100 [Catellatospora sp. IY07-71]